MSRESKFQHDLIKELKVKFRGCVVIKTDPTYIQGFPDLLVLYRNKWAALECKKNEEAKHRPNQDYWVDELCEMSYASFIFPENKEEILHEMELAFGRRPTRRS